MALKDARGNLLGTDSAAARDAAETALWRMMSFYDPPLPDLDRAIAHDPHWPLPHVMKAGFLLSLTEPSMVPDARSHLERAQSLLAAAPLREHAHWEGAERVFRSSARSLESESVIVASVDRFTCMLQRQGYAATVAREVQSRSLRP